MEAELPAAALMAAVAMLAVSALVWPLRTWLFGQQLIDFPEARRSHQHPTPRGGGLAIVIVLTLLWLVWPGAVGAWWPAMFPVLGMAWLGWVDDRRSVTARWRLIWQVLVAAMFLGLVGGMGSLGVFGFVLGPAWLWTGLAVIAVVWLINLHNFMDGSDGLASAQGCWTTLLMGLLFARAGYPDLASLAWAACGAWAGFLIWNRPPARVFMGDVGSLALGALIAALAVLGVTTGAFSVWTSLMICAVFVVDATATLSVRLWFRERWYTAHRQHAYQRLLDLGLQHGQVLCIYMLVNVLIVLPLVAAAQRWPHLDTLLAFGLATILVVGWQAVQSAAKANNNKVHCD